MAGTMLLKTKTVHTYNFRKMGLTEYVYFDSVDYYRDDGIYKRSTGRAGKKASEVSKRDRGIAVSRAKKMLRRVALHNNLHRMMTLTTQDNITDFELLDKFFKKFVFRLRAEYKDFKYMATRERQERGAVHYHVLINRFIPQKIALEIWTDLLKQKKYDVHKREYYYQFPDAKGTTDFRFIEGLEAIGYLIKYVGKSMNDPFITSSGHNAKAYLCSQDLDRNFKLTRKVTSYYVQMMNEYHDFQAFLKGLDIMTSDKSKVIFDNDFQFEMKSEVMYGRNILLKTG